MKTIQLTKILNFKRTLAAAALALAALAYATPGQATPHIISFDFSAPGDCSASIFDVAAKYSSCTLKAEAKAAKRGVEPNLAACDAKMVRWTKKSEKKCCSDSIGDPEEHEACIDSLDEAIVHEGAPNGDTCEVARGGIDLWQMIVAEREENAEAEVLMCDVAKQSVKNALQAFCMYCVVDRGVDEYSDACLGAINTYNMRVDACVEQCENDSGCFVAPSC